MPISLSGSLNLSGSLTTTGTITATTLVVQTITSSISSITGSTNFGSLSSNTHTFTGSINTSGSGNFSGSLTVGGFGSNVFSAGGTGYNRLKLVNTTAGVANGSQLSVGVDTDPDQLYIQSFSSTFTTSGMNVAGGAVINGEGAGGLNLAATQAGIGFYTNGSAAANLRMFISSSGNVGIGNSTALHKLQIGANADTKTSIGQSILFLSANAGNIGYVNEIGFGDVSSIYPQSAIGNIITNATAASYGDLYFATRAVTTDTAPTEKMRITSGGNLLIGAITSDSYSGYSVLQVGGSTLGLFQVFDGTVKTAVVSNGQSAGLIGTRTNHDLKIVTNDTERMRITTTGQLAIGYTSTYGPEALEITPRISGGTQYGIMINGSPASYAVTAMRFHYTGISIVGSITYNTTTTTYTTSSDYRLKKDLKDFNALNILSNIKLYDFAWRLNDSRMYGVMAHELKEVLPYAVIGEKDELDENGNVKSQGVDYSLITPVLVKAIQELTARVQELENK